MVTVFSEILNMSQWTTWFENNPYFINTQQIFIFNVSIWIIFYEKYD